MDEVRVRAALEIKDRYIADREQIHAVYSPRDRPYNLRLLIQEYTEDINRLGYSSLDEFEKEAEAYDAKLRASSLAGYRLAPTILPAADITHYSLEAFAAIHEIAVKARQADDIGDIILYSDPQPTRALEIRTGDNVKADHIRSYCRSLGLKYTRIINTVGGIDHIHSNHDFACFCISKGLFPGFSEGREYWLAVLYELCKLLGMEVAWKKDTCQLSMLNDIDVKICGCSGGSYRETIFLGSGFHFDVPKEISSAGYNTRVQSMKEVTTTAEFRSAFMQAVSTVFGTVIQWSQLPDAVSNMIQTQQEKYVSGDWVDSGISDFKLSS